MTITFPSRHDQWSGDHRHPPPAGRLVGATRAVSGTTDAGMEHECVPGGSRGQVAPGDEPDPGL